MYTKILSFIHGLGREVGDFLLVFLSITIVGLIVMNYKAVYLATTESLLGSQEVMIAQVDLEESYEIQTVEVGGDEKQEDIHISFSKIGWDEEMMSTSLLSRLHTYEYPLNLLPPGRRIQIPSLGVDAPIVSVNYVSQEKLLNGDFDEELRNGVVQYPHTPEPGEEGTGLLFGHSSVSERGEDKNNPYGYVFRKLSTLDEGETYSVIRDGLVYDYMIEHKEIVRPEEVAGKIEAYDALGGSTMTTMACYPLFSDAQRVLVRAKLLESPLPDTYVLKDSSISG